jgi:hypothetical protein
VETQDKVEARGLHQDHYSVRQALDLGLNRLVAYSVLLTKFKMRQLEELLAALRMCLRLVPLFLAKFKPQGQKQQ